EAPDGDARVLAHLDRHGHLRQESDAIIIRDELNEGCEAARAEAIAHGACRLAKVERLIAQAMAILEKKQVFMREDLGRERPCPVEARVAARREHEAIREEGKRRDLGMLDR